MEEVVMTDQRLDAWDLFDIPEVSKKTHTPEATLRFWRHKGTGPKSFLVGRRVMYRRVDIEAWLDAQYSDVGA